MPCQNSKWASPVRKPIYCRVPIGPWKGARWNRVRLASRACPASIPPVRGGLILVVIRNFGGFSSLSSWRIIYLQSDLYVLGELE